MMSDINTSALQLGVSFGGSKIAVALVDASTVSIVARGDQACSRFFMNGLMYRFHPQHQVIKLTMGAGDIGDVRLTRASFSFPLGPQYSTIRLDVDPAALPNS